MVSMGKSVTVLAGYHSTELVMILSVSVLDDVHKEVSLMFCTATIWHGTFGMTCWDENMAKQDKNSTKTGTKKAWLWAEGKKA